MRRELPRPSALAERSLAAYLPGRYRHVAGVAARASEVTADLSLSGDWLVSAAWLHDIGYAQGAVATGFHPLDGARFLAALGYERDLVNLVAFHSAACVEAEVRGLLHSLTSEFEEPESDALALLTYCDMTTDPTGHRTTVDQRLEDIFERYEHDDVVYRSIKHASPELRATVRSVENRLTALQSQ